MCDIVKCRNVKRVRFLGFLHIVTHLRQDKEHFWHPRKNPSYLQTNYSYFCHLKLVLPHKQFLVPWNVFCVQSQGHIKELSLSYILDQSVFLNYLIPLKDSGEHVKRILECPTGPVGSTVTPCVPVSRKQLQLWKWRRTSSPARRHLCATAVRVHQRLPDCGRGVVSSCHLPAASEPAAGYAGGLLVIHLL